jgi:hypothetical protein
LFGNTTPSSRTRPNCLREISLSAPGDKCLAWTFYPAPAAQELGEGRGRETVHRDRREESEHRLALPHADVVRLVDEANVPAHRSPLVLLLIRVSEEERELERFCESDELELGHGGQRFGDVPPIERSTEAHEGRALRGHEQMFALRGTRD